jgi:hypothetical protein
VRGLKVRGPVHFLPHTYCGGRGVLAEDMDLTASRQDFAVLLPRCRQRGVCYGVAYGGLPNTTLANRGAMLARRLALSCALMGPSMPIRVRRRDPSRNSGGEAAKGLSHHAEPSCARDTLIAERSVPLAGRSCRWGQLL